jgi:ATP-dependent DNA ligase
MSAAVSRSSTGGPGWIHEIKHDGLRILARRRGHTVRLITRNGHDFSDRFPVATEAIEALPIRSCVIDGEAIVCDDRGLAVFDLIRDHGTSARAILCAFDLLEVNSQDIKREPIGARKRRLARLLSEPGSTSRWARSRGRLELMAPRRFPPRWAVDEAKPPNASASFRDPKGQALA